MTLVCGCPQIPDKLPIVKALEAALDAIEREQEAPAASPQQGEDVSAGTPEKAGSFYRLLAAKGGAIRIFGIAKVPNWD